MDGIKTFRGRRNFWTSRIATRLQAIALNTLGRARTGSIQHRIIRKSSEMTIGDYLYVVKVDITDNCNLKCRMCYADNKNRETSISKLERIFRQIGGATARLDLLGGEPLLRKDIEKVIRLAKLHAAKEIVVYTNGVAAADSGLAERLAAAGLDKAIVTLISDDEEKHDAFTGVKGSWEKAVRGIRNFSKAGIATCTFSALHAFNMEDFDNIRNFVRDDLEATPIFYQYVPQSDDDPLLPNMDDWNAAKHKVLNEYCPDHFEHLRRILTFCNSVCLGGRRSLSVKVDGTVTPCPFISDIALGNVFEKNLWDIFADRHESSDFRRFMTFPPECLECSYKKICGGGCRAGNKLLFGDYLSRDCRCSGPWKEPPNNLEMPDKIPSFF